MLRERLGADRRSHDPRIVAGAGESGTGAGAESRLPHVDGRFFQHVEHPALTVMARQGLYNYLINSSGSDSNRDVAFRESFLHHHKHRAPAVTLNSQLVAAAYSLLARAQTPAHMTGPLIVISILTLTFSRYNELQRIRIEV